MTERADNNGKRDLCTPPSLCFKDYDVNGERAAQGILGQMFLFRESVPFHYIHIFLFFNIGVRKVCKRSRLNLCSLMCPNLSSFLKAGSIISWLSTPSSVRGEANCIRILRTTSANSSIHFRSVESRPAIRLPNFEIFITTNGKARKYEFNF